MPDPSPPALPPSLGSTSPARSPVSEPSRVSRHLLQVSALCGRQVAPAPGASGTPLTMLRLPSLCGDVSALRIHQLGRKLQAGTGRPVVPAASPAQGFPGVLSGRES